ncbi:MAG: radical SAM protein [Pirellula sp.]|jgi:radical SAM enzyme (TIGR01210 family)
MDLSQPLTNEQLRGLRTTVAQPTFDRVTRGVPQGALFEDEPHVGSAIIPTATYFLTGSECRYTCSMCDLWKYTTGERTDVGSLPRQIQLLHQEHNTIERGVRWLKLYNASNFFDTANVPEEDHDTIASLCYGFHRVIVENHAAMLGSSNVRQRILRFQEQLDGELELAMGLETIEPEAVRLLNKKMSLEQFADACRFLRDNEIRSRAFVLLQPPGSAPATSVEWTVKSCQWAFSCGIERCSIIPTRPGNGFTDTMIASGQWQPPEAKKLEDTMDAMDLGLSSEHRIATVDLWDWNRISGTCEQCCGPRRLRLEAMNMGQCFLPRIRCVHCDP